MKTWREYAHRWQAGTDWPPIEDATVKPEDRRTYLQTLGDEWGDKTWVEQLPVTFCCRRCRPKRRCWTSAAAAAELRGMSRAGVDCWSVSTSNWKFGALSPHGAAPRRRRPAPCADAAAEHSPS